MLVIQSMYDKVSCHMKLHYQYKLSVMFEFLCWIIVDVVVMMYVYYLLKDLFLYIFVGSTLGMYMCCLVQTS